MAQIDKSEKLAPLRPLELAFKSMLLLVQHRFDEAEELRDHVAKITESAQNPEGRYINLYVRSTRASIEGDYVLMNHLLREEEALKVSQRFKDWLPIRD